MSRPPTKRSIKAKLHKAWADRIKERDNHLCQLCRKPHRVLNSHHLLPQENYPFARYELLNGICLCFRCHKCSNNSPHRDPLGFIRWLRVYKADQYDWCMEQLDDLETPQDDASDAFLEASQQEDEI